MKKIFTLISVALCAMSVNAQDKYVAVDADGNLSAEFAAIIDADNKATNVVDGKSIVTINTENVTLEAVGGTIPANVEGSGAQQITPGDAIPDYVDQSGNAHPYAHQVKSVEAWADITWKNEKNSDPIAVDASRISILMGTGNPYIKLLCEEIVQDDEPTGTYKALYEYYKPGMDMPQVGLYYKFSPKTDGTLKVTVWANKGNRNSYLINGETKEAVAYTAEGYINGQKATDADGNKIIASDGKEVLKFFTAAEIKEQHDNAKVKDGVDTAPYVIAAGNQPFWGYLTFEVKAGSTYWLFQDSSQIGFGGYEFTASGAGINTVKAQNAQSTVTYNLAGQVVSDSFKGLVIKNGKKYFNK